MRSTDKIKVVSVEKFANYICTKCERHAPVIFTPSLDIFVWIRPQQITQQTYRNIAASKFEYKIYRGNLFYDIVRKHLSCTEIDHRYAGLNMVKFLKSNIFESQ